MKDTRGSWSHLDRRAEDYKQRFKEKLERIEEELLRLLERYSEHPLTDHLRYALEGGKRLRPLISVLAYEAIGGGKEDPYLASTIPELLHTVSIVHDDIIDKESIRRGRKPFYKVFGVENSLLLADFVFSIILDIAASYDNKRLLEAASRAAMLMSEGEYKELLLLSKPSISFDDYLEVISLKTASLFEVSAEIAPILADKRELEETLSRFGWYIGMCYQLVDDAEDAVNGGKVELLSLINPKPKIDSMIEEAKRYALLALQEILKLPESVARHDLESLARTIIA
jgi:octaprenyl-diphosphate synthase